MLGAKEILEKDKERPRVVNGQLKAKIKARGPPWQSAVGLASHIAGGQMKQKLRLRI